MLCIAKASQFVTYKITQLGRCCQGEMTKTQESSQSKDAGSKSWVN